MSPTWTKKLAHWRTKHRERIAKAVLSKPTVTTMGRLLKSVGVILIMGDRRAGKSGLAFKIQEHFHDKKGLPGAVCYPHTNRKLRRLLPKWIKIVTRVKDLPPGHVCIIDEAALVAHARRTQSGAALDMEELVALSEQKGQLIVLICHHSRKLDINDVHGSNLIIWKQPTAADTIWERSELELYVLRAWEFFQGLYPENWSPLKPIPKKVLQSNFVMNLRRMEFYTFRNDVPTFWTNEMSTVFKLLGEDRQKLENKLKAEKLAKKGVASSEKGRGTKPDRNHSRPDAKGGGLAQSKGDVHRGRQRAARH